VLYTDLFCAGSEIEGEEALEFLLCIGAWFDTDPVCSIYFQPDL